MRRSLIGKTFYNLPYSGRNFKMDKVWIVFESEVHEGPTGELWVFASKEKALSFIKEHNVYDDEGLVIYNEANGYCEYQLYSYRGTEVQK